MVDRLGKSPQPPGKTGGRLQFMAFYFLKRVFGSGDSSGHGLLLPSDQFRTLILHECARCDRNAHAFSLIQIDLRGNGGHIGRDARQAVRILSRALAQRMRSTDEVGWLDGHSIGVFLPETERDGAQSFAQDTCQGFSYQIYTYPWISGFNTDAGSGESRREDKGQKDQRPGTIDGAGTENQSNHHPEHACETGSTDRAGIHGAENLAKSIEELVLPDRASTRKRAYDIFGSAVLLIALSPIFAAVALYIKIVSPGPVFFRQKRIGYRGRPFTMIKFRTMRMGSDNVSVHKDYLKDLINDGSKVMTKLDTDKDDRLIPLAGILRRSCIDELPQLINVFKGDMSLVGPRPCLDYEAREFALWQRRRFHTIPGMTGLWQVSGKNRLTFQEMMRLDIRYANRRNAAMDLMISFRTVPAILGQVKDAVQVKYFKRAAPAQGPWDVA
jgi:lipopolysaccharide/colanic/teichoic acid biosynthesis glycosyltransferase